MTATEPPPASIATIDGEVAVLAERHRLRNAAYADAARVPTFGPMSERLDPDA